MQKVKRTFFSASSACAQAILIFAAGAALLARAQSDPEVPDNDRSPYHQALLNYKSGNYDAAALFVDEAEKAQPDSIPVELLKVRILTEQRDYKRAERVLENLSGDDALTPADGLAITLATGDLELRQHRFGEASKHYESLLAQKPGDPDIKLKLIYARIGVNDLVEAGKLASELTALDPANPAYYFARAALAKDAGNSGDEEQDIQQARTIYGITLTNRYLKTYLEVFSGNKDSISNALNPPPAMTNAAPAPAKP
jgi:tetratricopeptide (TPR) repeat protein